jgi:hypothetical protein
MGTNKAEFNRTDIRRELNSVIFLAIFVSALIASSCTSETVENTGLANSKPAADPNANAVLPVPQNSSDVPPVNAGKRLEYNANQRPGKLPKQYEQAAPEDSTFSVALGEKGIETRVFKNHPTIARVEKIVGPGGANVTVYLKNGKSASAPGEKIPDLKNALSTDILNAAGLPLPVNSTAKPDDPNSKKKKSKN